MHTQLTNAGHEVRVEGVAYGAETPWQSVTDNTRMRTSCVTQDIPTRSNVATGIREPEICPIVTKQVVTVASNVTLAALCVEGTRAPPSSKLVYRRVGRDDAAFRLKLVMSTWRPASVYSTEVIRRDGTSRRVIGTYLVAMETV